MSTDASTSANACPPNIRHSQCLLKNFIANIKHAIKQTWEFLKVLIVIYTFFQQRPYFANIWGYQIKHIKKWNTNVRE